MQSPVQPSEAWDDRDDWSGVASPVERRKRQNRLSQRAYRTRKHIQRFSPPSPRYTSKVGGQGKRKPEDGAINSTRDQVGRCDIVEDGSLGWILSISSNLRRRAIEFKQSVFLDTSLNLQAPPNLQILVRLNVLNALASNAVALSIPFLDLDRDDCISPFNLQGPQPPGADGDPFSLPDSLRPTALQKSVIHHPWIDLFPLPGIRDNILRRLGAMPIDGDNLCSDLFTVDDTDGALARIVVWGEPCDPSSWELSPDFFRKWSCLVQGCPEILGATNCWRQKRGQMKINFIVD